MTYVRNSVLRANGQNPNAVLNVRQMAKRATENLVAIVEITGPVIEKARKNGTDSSGTIRKIDRLARQLLIG